MNREKHIKYFKRNLQLVPNAYQSFASNHVTLVFFCLAGLELLDALDDVIDTDVKRKEAIDWIYGLQVIPKDGASRGGFRGGPFSGCMFNPGKGSEETNKFDTAHIANTYAALASLVLLRDDLSRVDRKGISRFLKECRQTDGSFSATPSYREKDMRFVYCACASSFILNDWDGVDREKTIEYIRRSHAYDYGIAQGPGFESHGGSTYCAVASLKLMGCLNDSSDGGLLNQRKIVDWCLMRQVSGFQGRRNKDPDSCYSFWIGSSLTMLGAYHMVDHKLLEAFLMETETPYGGVGKVPGCPPGLVGYFLATQDPALKKWDVSLNVSMDAVNQLRQKAE